MQQPKRLSEEQLVEITDLVQGIDTIIERSEYCPSCQSDEMIWFDEEDNEVEPDDEGAADYSRLVHEAGCLYQAASGLLSEVEAWLEEVFAPEPLDGVGVEDDETLLIYAEGIENPITIPVNTTGDQEPTPYEGFWGDIEEMAVLLRKRDAALAEGVVFVSNDDLPAYIERLHFEQTGKRVKVVIHHTDGGTSPDDCPECGQLAPGGMCMFCGWGTEEEG